MFKKAEPEQGFIKMSIYGPQGSGKTFTALLIAEGLAAHMRRRVAVVDTERGTDFYCKEVPKRSVHPAAFDFDAIYTRSLLDTSEAIMGVDTNVHGVVILDSMSHMWDAAIGAYEGKTTKADTIPMQAWGKIKKPYKELLRFLMDAPMHVLILGRQKNIFENTPDGQMIKTGVGMRAEGETEYEPHICARMESKKDKDDSARSTVYAIFEKDRTGILAGRTYANPTFTIFEPVMPLLNGQQAQSEDPDEVAARDSELLEKETEKKKAKEEKSAVLFKQFNGEITVCDSLDELNSIATELKKQKRYIVEDHLNSIRLIYGQRHDDLSKQQAPAEV